MADARDYMEIAEEANKPLSRRRAITKGRGGKAQVPRRYHLNDNQFEALNAKMKEAGHFVSPFRKGGGAYNAIIEALIRLGENIWHDVGSVFAAFEEYLKLVPSRKKGCEGGRTGWDDYEKKTLRNEETGLDPYGKFLQNCRVLQRIDGDNRYGFKLAQLGACLDTMKDDQDNYRIRLRTGITDLVIPMRETKSRSLKSPTGIRPGKLGLKPESAKKVSTPDCDQVAGNGDDANGNKQEA